MSYRDFGRLLFLTLSHILNICNYKINKKKNPLNFFDFPSSFRDFSAAYFF